MANNQRPVIFQVFYLANEDTEEFTFELDQTKDKPTFSKSIDELQIDEQDVLVAINDVNVLGKSNLEVLQELRQEWESNSVVNLRILKHEYGESQALPDNVSYFSLDFRSYHACFSYACLPLEYFANTNYWLRERILSRLHW